MSNLKIRERLKEIKEIKNSILSDEKVQEEVTLFPNNDLENGISVIIPVHQGENFIENLVDSLKRQSLDYKFFEAVFVFNGEYEKSEKLLSRLDKPFKYKVLYSNKGVGTARNTGINNADYSYITFLDVDDTLSFDYLKNSLSEAEPYTILLNQLHEIVETRDDHGNNVINKELLRLNQYPNSYFDVGKNLSLNGAKIVPTSFLLNTQFNEKLNNGEDVVLYAALVTEFKPIIKINQSQAVYYRYKGQGTLSRTKISFQFNVLDRINVIDALQSLLQYEDNLDVRNLIIDRMRSQALFINKYLLENIEEYSKVTDLIKFKQDEFYPYQQVNKDLAKTLYISYCFPPFVDTSGVVMAKRINQGKQPVDVVFNDMTDVRAMDPSLEVIANPYIDTKYMINTVSSFSNANYIKSFVDKVKKRVELYKYNQIYSRALWPGSHMAAFEFKEENNNIKWIAEFSDPILFDIKNQERKAGYFSAKEVKRLKKKVPRNFEKYVNNNLFNMCEVLPFIFADEIVFTNINQQSVMLERFSEEFQNMVYKKSVISKHPSLDEYYYDIDKHYVSLDQSEYNIGYFGNFYETRSASDIINIAKTVKDANIKAKLYIFTNDTSKVRSQVITQNVSDIVQVNTYLKYFEFLNASKEFDCLILSDANTKDYMKKNPYLASKYSDYISSGTDIWSLYENGSVLSEIVKDNNSRVVGSELGNIEEIKETLFKLTENHKKNES
ncbi:Putative glycosyltransferase EpsH [Jeotgalicoccus aerolatus]|uniref:Putative glycosyltransferase TagX n=1 Tax=Jeotgalicoccus aerolatus TaxID=709510 RepID=A0ABS4HK67_9STAP|nr:glycosyltransferase [Jeotgalicoccus aerolatus]MBP1951318.1 glycosyltransferase involved in cell wall biosynthesis [Jeotgalicoccus aerolatus]GGD98437.1 hypothetical protein GCM10007273_08600 [Jeotgalicoccus aerolatus]CAD2077174.1 Putative glycosyltransferase EpsH [Jeotgalicoccus aerolatus]